MQLNSLEKRIVFLSVIAELLFLYTYYCFIFRNIIYNLRLLVSNSGGNRQLKKLARKF